MSQTSPLEKLLRQASVAYYAGADAIMSDAEFDLLLDKLEVCEPGNAFLGEVGAPADSALTKVKHSIPMGSLKKISPGDGPAEFATWISTVSKKATDLEMVVQWKIDGLSVELVFENGKFVQAITRGDGEIGEDVTHTIRNAQGFPRTIETKARVSVRCEAVLFLQAWKDYFPDKANPRNAASGLVRRADAKGSVHITCIAFDVCLGRTVKFEDGVFFQTEKERISWLKAQGFEVTATEVVPANKVAQYVASIEVVRDCLPFGIDGAVVKLNSVAEQEKLGEHDGRPYWARAWKFAALGGHTTIVGVEWAVGTQGTINPVAKVAPVKVGGTTIQNVTLHNMDVIERLGVQIGDEVEVVRAGDVIPYIVRVVSKGKKRTKITINACPACGSKLHRDGPKLLCTNVANCEGSQFKRIQKWIKKREIMFLGESNLQTLWDANVVRSVVGLYRLTVDLMVAAGLGKRMAEKILEEIKKSRVTTLSDFVGSLSIDMLGRSEAANLVGHGIDTLDKWKDVAWGNTKIDSFSGYQNTKASRIATGLKAGWSTIARLSAELVISSVSTKPTSVRLADLSFCFTGKMNKPRKELEDLAKKHGGEVRSVSGSLTYLVIADQNSKSSKAVKARTLGVSLISEDGFLKMVK